MKANHLLVDLQFHDTLPFAQPLLVDQYSRILRWMLKPGQQIAEHRVPGSPFYVLVIQGRGVFAGGDGQQETYGPGSLLVFEPDEPHTVAALDEELVFIGFLRSVESMREDRVGGEMGREETE